MSKKTQFVEVAVQAATMLASSGAVIAAGFAVDDVVKLKNNATLVKQIDSIDSYIQTKVEVAVGLAIASGLVIPVGIFMIMISLCKINLGACKKVAIITDMVVLLLAMCGFGVAGTFGAVVANDWTIKIMKAVNTRLVRDIPIEFGALSGCSFLAFISCAMLIIFIIVQYVRHNAQEKKERSTFKYTSYTSL